MIEPPAVEAVAMSQRSERSKQLVDTLMSPAVQVELPAEAVEMAASLSPDQAAGSEGVLADQPELLISKQRTKMLQDTGVEKQAREDTELASRINDLNEQVQQTLARLKTD